MIRTQIDEVEMAERAFLLELISTVLQLSYASLCEHQIWELINSSCEGCKLQLPGKKDHICMMTNNGEAFNQYYDDATLLVDSNRVWELANEIYTAMIRTQIDEVEMAERAFLLELISTVLQLSYASLCEHQIWELKS
ncbi:hypothetical protein AC249_AIPGENE15580 [Exaiptasia diaphana]|nr:hypothetical protein AC249_AIPGENE15580 [Exaiptasia diaphana]